jgi:hypothetical protein
MPQTLIVIFLLMFAILAFAWFYWQRAKARSSENVVTDRERPRPSDSPPAS